MQGLGRTQTQPQEPCNETKQEFSPPGKDVCYYQNQKPNPNLFWGFFFGKRLPSNVITFTIKCYIVYILIFLNLKWYPFYFFLCYTLPSRVSALPRILLDTCLWKVPWETFLWRSVSSCWSVDKRLRGFQFLGRLSVLANVTRNQQNHSQNPASLNPNCYLFLCQNSP